VHAIYWKKECIVSEIQNNKGECSRRRGNKRKPPYISHTEINEEKGWCKFLVRQQKKNGISQLMVIKAGGEPSFAWFTEANELIKFIETLKSKKVKYESIFINCHRPKRSYSPNVELNQLYKASQVKGKILKDEDYGFYTNFFIDFDPVCKELPVPHKIMEQCLLVRDEVKKWLMEEGFPEPISGSTGNGGCLHFPVKGFRNNSTTVNLIKKSLQYLHQHFHTEEVKVDAKVYNPSRLCRVFSTLNRKGRSRNGHRYRLAKIDSYPSKIKLLEYSGFVPFCEKHSLIGQEAKTEFKDKEKPSVPAIPGRKQKMAKNPISGHQKGSLTKAHHFDAAFCVAFC
jgi:hypothetical protein